MSTATLIATATTNGVDTFIFTGDGTEMVLQGVTGINASWFL
jgi:hypothetical protein